MPRGFGFQVLHTSTNTYKIKGIEMTAAAPSNKNGGGMANALPGIGQPT